MKPAVHDGQLLRICTCLLACMVWSFVMHLICSVCSCYAVHLIVCQR